MNCDSHVSGDCEATEAARKAFSFLLDPIETALRRSLDAALVNEAYNTDMERLLVYSLTYGNKSNGANVVKKYESAYRRYRIGQVNFTR